ncbi:MAG TPA: Hpt domain-containing protein [Xanthobacteraceae bacterium]|nr:Hpt domain-containing protein [Xanthobacteraceae bacterium]
MSRRPEDHAEASVTKFKDYEVITPPNKLEKAVVHARPSEHYEPDPVARAEQALLTLSNDFAQWMEAECRRLDAARRKVREAGLTDAARDELFRAAHDIKGEAATFGFPLIEPVARSLCRLIEHSPEPARIPLVLLDQHVDGVRAIVHRNAQGNSERKAQVLAERLRQVTEEFLAHENRNRPGYLDEVAAPALAPDPSSG